MGLALCVSGSNNRQSPIDLFEQSFFGVLTNKSKGFFSFAQKNEGV